MVIQRKPLGIMGTIKKMMDMPSMTPLKMVKIRKPGSIHMDVAPGFFRDTAKSAPLRKMMPRTKRYIA